MELPQLTLDPHSQHLQHRPTLGTFTIRARGTRASIASDGIKNAKSPTQIILLAIDMMSLLQKPRKKVVLVTDWNACLNNAEPDCKTNIKPSSERKLNDQGRNFKKFVSHLDPPDWRYWLEKKFSLQLNILYLEYYLQTHDVEHHGSLLSYSKYFTMFCVRERKQEAPPDHKKKLKNWVNSEEVKEDYGLDPISKEQPPFNVDDLLFNTYHLLAYCTIKFPSMRSIFQMNSLRKMMCATSARPGTLIESTGYLNSNDGLKWKDIRLFMVKDPDHPVCRTLLIRVEHRLQKGRRNSGKAPCYTYTERNDNLGLCVIQDILLFAFLDNAFDSPYIKRPEHIWSLTSVPDHRKSVPIHFKESVMNIPIFRSASETSPLLTHPDKIFQYHQLRKWEGNASEEAGFEWTGTLYKYRKGAAAQFKDLDEHTRNKIMGHVHGGTFTNYLSIMEDTQSIFLGTPARKALVSLATHASLTRDPSAPREESIEQRAEIEKEHKLVQMKDQHEELLQQIAKKYGSVKKCQNSGDKRAIEIERLRNAIKFRRSRLRREAKSQRRAEHFRQIGNLIIEKNHFGLKTNFVPETKGIHPDRAKLAKIEYQNRDIGHIPYDNLVQERIRSLEIRLRLCLFDMPGGYALELESCDENVKNGKMKEKKPLACLLCPVCLGRAGLRPGMHGTGEFKFSRKDALVRHFNSHELPAIFGRAAHRCDIPGCESSFASLPRYKFHLAREHMIFL